MDMDGTLLNSDSKVTEATADTLRRCIAQGDATLMVATGKARPAVMAAFAASGLAGATAATRTGCTERSRCVMVSRPQSSVEVTVVLSQLRDHAANLATAVQGPTD